MLLWTYAIVGCTATESFQVEAVAVFQYTRAPVAVDDEVETDFTTTTAAPSHTSSADFSQITVSPVTTNNSDINNSHVFVTATPTPAPCSDDDATTIPVEVNNMRTATPSVSWTEAPYSQHYHLYQQPPVDDDVDIISVRIPEMSMTLVLQRQQHYQVVPTTTNTTTTTTTMEGYPQKSDSLLFTYLHGFVDTLIRASDAVPASALQHSNLDMETLHMAATTVADSSSSLSSSSSSHTMGIVLNGKAYLDNTIVMMSRSSSPSFVVDRDRFGASLRHSVVSYLSFWGTSELEAGLEMAMMGTSNVTVASFSIDGIEALALLEEEEVLQTSNVGGNLEEEEKSSGAAAILAWDVTTWMWWITTATTMTVIGGIVL